MKTKQEPLDIAIVSAGIRFPGAASLEEFWRHIAAGHDLVRSASPERWPLSAAALQQGEGRVADAIAHDRVYEVEASASSAADSLGDELALAGLDRLFHLTLGAGRDALRGVQIDSIKPSRCGVILGNIALPTAASSARTYHWLRRELGEAQSGLPDFARDPVNDAVAAQPALFLAQTLGFRGASFTLDAACASSLYSLKWACDAIAEGELDFVLAGGVSCPSSLYTQIGFTALQALSRDGRCFPLDARADGLLVGEGAGIFGLKSRARAVADGDTILALIRGIGLANDRDGRLMAPSSEGQLRAMRAAYAQAGWSPAEVDLIECHATGTPVGDSTEFASLKALWQESGSQGEVVIGSVKSNVGHMLTAAGAAGIAKLLQAIGHATLPPTANFQAAPAAWEMDQSAFSVLQQARPWPEAKGRARRAAISGFGFGGINAHLLLEEYRVTASVPSVSLQPRQAVAIVGWADLDLDLAGVQREGPELAIKGFQIGYQQFRIPPAELREVLPQQLLGLLLGDALRLPDCPDAVLREMACFVGLELDATTNLYASRWALEGDRPASRRDQSFRQWQDLLVPALNANRVIGSLGSIVASRIAREARLGGSSFTLSALDHSGLAGLQRAFAAIARGEIPAALVLALELPSSLRARAQLAEAGEEGPALDSAVGLTLMREELARELGLPVLAILREVAQLEDAKGPGQGGEAYRGAAAGLHTLLCELRDAAADTVMQSQIAGNDGYAMRVEFERLTSPRSPAKPDSEAKQLRIERRDLSLEPWLHGQPGGPSKRVHLKDAISDEVKVNIKQRNNVDLYLLDPISIDPNESFESPAIEQYEINDSYQHAHDEATTVPPHQQRSELRPQNIPVIGLEALLAQEKSHIQAHQEFLRYRLEGQDFAQRLLELLGGASSTPEPSRAEAPSPREASPAVPEKNPGDRVWVAAPLSSETALFDYDACQEFATGSIEKVFGSDFAVVDTFAKRVRLPDARLLLCHRVMAMSGVAKSLGAGTMVTEHDVFPQAWYLDDGLMPTAIAVEAGQADLMLAAFLGADFHGAGRAVYRLLDAKVCFHRSLPRAGEIVRYAIQIKRFFEQGGTLFFHFAFEATIDGQPLMSMQDGCAGFFSPEALEAGRGIKRSQLQLKPRAGIVSGDFRPLVDLQRISLTASELDALRTGDYASAFGPAFAELKLQQPKGLPGGELRLVHRIIDLDPMGGRFQCGRIIGEADIQADDWFLTCHFIDDQVMPGTLMYECCLHTLRVYLLRLGWVGEADQLQFQPLPGRLSQLKCRGQVLPETRVVRYDIEIKEIGYGPAPYVICDALMSADGKPIVDITDMTLHLPTSRREDFESLWASKAPAPPALPAFTGEQILAFASGRPSDCFGPVYQVFDEERRIARLPRPPYQFLDRIDWVQGPWMEQAVGTQLCAVYEVPQDAWYWQAEGSRTMPLSVLVEIALQPCGFMAAYMGSALLSPRDLSFRNLSGTAQLHQPVRADVGRLWVDIRCTKISKTSDMIIQDYHFLVRSRAGTLYDGVTQFGFFAAEALQQQVGLRDQSRWLDPGLPFTTLYPEHPALPQVPLLMVDQIDRRWAPAGRYEQGILYGKKQVRAAEWFFDAHFYQDPVMPGSLGLQALEQVLRAEAARIWPDVESWQLKTHADYSWSYRGQVVPTAGELQYELHVERIDHESQEIRADAWLYCDGLPIYSMTRLWLAPLAPE